MRIWITILFTSLVTLCSHAQNLQNLTKSKPFEVSGSVSASTGFYGMSGLANDRQAPFNYSLYGRLNVKVYGVAFPLYVSVRDHSFNYSKTFYRLKFNPTYKWIKLHVGDTRLSFNRYTLSGRTIRGAGVELTPGIVRVKAVYGKSRDLRSFRDTLQLGALPLETYTRRTAGLGVGIGKENNNFDIYAVRTWDDAVDGAQIERPPEDNLVLGSSIRLRLFEKLRFTANAAASALTHNTRSFGNTSLGIDNVAEDVFTANLSTDLSFAGDVSASYRFKTVGLNAKVSYIEAFFDPLSVAYINNDLINYTLGTKINFGRGKVYLNADVGVQQNNLSGRKAATANRVIINVLSNIRFSQRATATLRYNNFQQDFQARLIQLDELYTYAVTTANLMGMFSYRFGTESRPLTLNLTGGLQDFTTVASDSDVDNSYQSYNASARLGMTFKESGLNVNTGVNYRNYDNGRLQRQNYGLTGAVRMPLFQERMTAGWTSAFNYNDSGDFRIGWTLRNGISLGYNVDKMQQLSLRLQRLDRNLSQSRITETRGSIRYGLKF